MAVNSVTIPAKPVGPHDCHFAPVAVPGRSGRGGRRGLERIPIKPYQIVVWVSVTARAVIELPRDAPRFPAVLDTGHSHNFSIQDKQLTQGAALEVATLPRIASMRERGRHLPLHAANPLDSPEFPRQA